eukprot:746864-Hanusia_phi.AAC.2
MPRLTTSRTCAGRQRAWRSGAVSSRDLDLVQLRHDDLVETNKQWEEMQFTEDAHEPGQLHEGAKQQSDSAEPPLLLQDPQWCLLSGRFLRVLPYLRTSGFVATDVFRNAGINEETLKPLNSFLQKAIKKLDEVENPKEGDSSPLPPAKSLKLVQDIFAKVGLTH